MTSLRVSVVTALLLVACSQQRSDEAKTARNATIASNTGQSVRDKPDSVLAANTQLPDDIQPAVARTSQSPHTTVVGSLKTELVGIGTLDGAPITDVIWSSRCNTTFVTDKATVTIDWSKVGDFAGEIAGRKATIPIDDGSGVHRFTMPNNVTFDRVDGSMGLLANDCGGPL